ncbi:MAG: hypothetical protein EOP55_22275 [Sphingobacteriales bacterium]|nr:MAG: hypothetical protein EOP55_22275 [Sphingobacteriales bacterium]
MSNIKNPLNPNESKTFVEVKNGALCNAIHQGYIQVLSNTHPSKKIWVNLKITSLPARNDTNGEEIIEFKDYTLAPKTSINLLCDVPGPTSQRFFWTPVEVEWA